jgi:hypothetical protein
MRGKATRANGIRAQNPTSDALKIASAHRFAASGAGAVARKASDGFKMLRSFA